MKKNWLNAAHFQLVLSADKASEEDEGNGKEMGWALAASGVGWIAERRGIWRLFAKLQMPKIEIMTKVGLSAVQEPDKQYNRIFTRRGEWNINARNYQ